MKIIAITQARYGSTRLRGKVLLKVKGKTLLQIHLERILRAKKVDGIILATTFEKETDQILEIARKLEVLWFQGSTENVLERFFRAAEPHQPDYVVRLTSDCPLIDPEIIDQVVQKCVDEKLDYCSNTLAPTFPDGCDVEVFRFTALEKAFLSAHLKSDKEHVTPFIWRDSSFFNGNSFKSANFSWGEDCSKYRLTVDTIADFELISKLISKIGDSAGWVDYVNILRNNDELFKINSGLERNEGLKKSIKEDTNEA